MDDCLHYILIIGAWQASRPLPSVIRAAVSGPPRSSHRDIINYSRAASRQRENECDRHPHQATATYPLGIKHVIYIPYRLGI